MRYEVDTDGQITNTVTTTFDLVARKLVFDGKVQFAPDLSSGTRHIIYLGAIFNNPPPNQTSITVTAP